MIPLIRDIGSRATGAVERFSRRLKFHFSAISIRRLVPLIIYIGSLLPSEISGGRALATCVSFGIQNIYFVMRRRF